MTTETERLLVLMQFEADQAEKQAKRHERTLNALERQVDKLGPATQRYNRQLKAIEALYEAGSIDVQRYANSIKLAEQQFDQAARSAGQMSVSGSNLTSILARNRSALQNVGYQVGDFAVQVQGGTSVLTAFTQQGSQLLGFLGAYGAIAGAALAIGVPLIASFLDSGEAAESLKDQIEGLIEAVDAYRATAKEISAAELVEEFGPASEAMRNVLLAQRDLLEAVALKELSEAVAATVAEFGNLSEQLVTPRRTLTFFEGTVKDLAERFDITRARARVFAYTLQDLGRADGPEAQAHALTKVREELVRVSNGVDNMNDVTREVYERMLDAEAAALSLASVDMTTEISNAASEAARLAQNLQAARGARVDAATGGNVDFFDPRNEAGTAGRLVEDRSVPRENRPGYTPGTWRGGGGGGRRRGGADRAREVDYLREITQLQRRLDLIGKTTSEVAGLEARWRLLDELKRQGIQVDDAVNSKINQTASEVERLTAQLEKGRLRQEKYEQGLQSIADGFANAIVEGRGLSGVLADVGKQMASRALSNVFMSVLTRGLGGLGARFFGAAAPAAMGLLRAQQMPSIAPSPTLRQRATTGSAQQVEVQVVGGDLTVGDDGKVMARMRVIAGQAATQGVADVRRNFGSMSAKFQRDGVL